MVKEVGREEEKYFQCEICKLVYKDRKWTKKCEEWCKKNKSCNIEITKHAVK